MSRAVVADLIRSRFAALQTTQVAFAARLGVDPATVNKWLKGTQLPGPAAVPVLAEALGVDERDLLRAIAAAQRDETKQLKRELAQTRDNLAELMAWAEKTNRQMEEAVSRVVATDQRLRELLAELQSRREL